MKNFLLPKKSKISAHRLEKDRRKADRIKTILFLNEGFSYEQTARLLLLDDTTVGGISKNLKSQELTDCLRIIVDKTEYSLDNGSNWTTYTAPLVFNEEGEISLAYRSRDGLGNLEATQSITISIAVSSDTTVHRGGK